MIKIFLVEDEIVVRNGIKNKIDWESAGLQLVGDAGDGEIAYPLILETKPDIIITDIKMPFLDGLTLAQMVRDEMPHVKVIILSGYNEFEFAKEAIQIGITDYIVKPVIKENLLEVVQKAAAEVVAERKQQAMLEKYEKEMEEMYFFRRQEFFTLLLSGRQPIADMIKQGREAGVDIIAGAYIVVAFSYRRKDASDEAYHESSVQLQDDMLALTENKPDIISFSRSLAGWHFLIKGKDEKDARDILAKYLAALIDIVMHYRRFDYFVGVGRPVARISEIATSFDEAIKAHSYRYIREANQVIYADQLETKSHRQGLKTSDEKAVVHPERMERGAIERFLKIGSEDEVKAFVDDYCSNVGVDCLSFDLIRQHICLDIYCCCEQFLKYLECDQEKIETICGSLETLETKLSDPKHARENLCHMLRDAIYQRDVTSKKRYDPLLQKAKAYIDEKYGSADISLNQVASHVNISASHFSTIFSQEIGKTFTEYLTEVRIQSAKQLLKCTQKLTGEIGYAVGYKDAHYFSYVFKKATGVTPSEYRANKTGGATA